MLIVISPAKNLDFEVPVITQKYSMPEFLHDSQLLIDELRQYDLQGLIRLMNISYRLGEINLDRVHKWQTPYNGTEAKPAALVFDGDVYKGLKASDFDESDFDYAQKSLRILSGLYGVLRPLDLILPYRLEMSTKLRNQRGKNLYDFWDTKITDKLNNELAGDEDRTLINLASNEYFKAVKEKQINAKIINPVFKEMKNGRYKVVSFYAKKARGLISRFMIKNKLQNVEDLKLFDYENYLYIEELSTETDWVFAR